MNVRAWLVGVLCVAVMAMAGFWVWKVFNVPTVSVEKKERDVPYYLFTEKDGGTTTDVMIGGTVIVMLPLDVFVGTTTLIADGKPITFRSEEYEDSHVAAFTVPKADSLVFSVGTSSLFTLTFTTHLSVQ